MMMYIGMLVRGSIAIITCMQLSVFARIAASVIYWVAAASVAAHPPIAGAATLPALMPADLVTTDYVKRLSGDEPYLIKCTPRANRIVLFLHTWSSNYMYVAATFPELSSLKNVCVVSPNFNGPNDTANALGSNDSLERIARVVNEIKARTGISRVHIAAVSGGTMAALNFMGKYPGTVQRAVLWHMIHDLAELFAVSADPSLKVDMVKAIGAPPAGRHDPLYAQRSPRTRLATIKGPATIFINTGATDTGTPASQGRTARDQIRAVAPDIKVIYREWPFGHAFGPQQRKVALRQLGRQ